MYASGPIKGRYHTVLRQSVAPAGQERCCTEELPSRAPITRLVAPPPRRSVGSRHLKARATLEESSSPDQALALPASPASPDRLCREETFHPAPGAPPAPVTIRFPHSN